MLPCDQLVWKKGNLKSLFLVHLREEMGDECKYKYIRNGLYIIDNISYRKIFDELKYHLLYIAYTPIHAIKLPLNTTISNHSNEKRKYVVAVCYVAEVRVGVS